MSLCLHLWPAIALLSFHAPQVHAVQQHGQVGGANLDAVAVARRRRETKRALLQPLVPDRQRDVNDLAKYCLSFNTVFPRRLLQPARSRLRRPMKKPRQSG